MSAVMNDNGAAARAEQVVPAEIEPVAQPAAAQDAVVAQGTTTEEARLRSVNASQITPSQEATVDDARDLALAYAMKALCCRSSQRKSHRNLLRQTQTEKVTPFQIFHLLRRVCAFAAAVIYVVISMMASYATVHVLRGMENPIIGAGSYTSDYIVAFAGTGNIRKSPLVVNVLANDTTPRTGVVFLTSETDVSATGCPSEQYNAEIYSNTFARYGLDALTRYTAYNLTFLATSELVVPVIDCSQTSIQIGDDSSGRVDYLMRSKTNINDVFLLVMTFSCQDYIMEERSEKGPGLVATLTTIHDMQQTDLEHYFVLAAGYPFVRVPNFQVYEFVAVTSDTMWHLRSIPRNPATEAVKDVLTACRTGFYIDSETDQSNIVNQHWSLRSDAVGTLTTWDWYGRPIVRDSWAWVHGIHFLFGVQTIMSLLVLNIVIYRNVQAGKIWIGNAFASISNSLLLRGALVLASWQMNEFWTLKEFCLANASELADNEAIYVHEDIMHADLLNVYMCFVTVLGYIFKERIDPTIVLVLFEVGFQNRLSIVQTMPSLVSAIKDFEQADIARGQIQVTDLLAQISPMRLWTVHPLTGNAKAFIFATMCPVVITLAGVLVVIALRKVYHHYCPEKVYAQTMTESSTNEKRIEQQKLSLTMFEIATGAALRAKFGVISDYENYLFIKGTKYATADGVYCNGYVVANGKFLVATNDLLSIIAMKITRLRFTNVYVYDVVANDVKQTARLVYPSTLSWRDLASLNINILK